MVWSFLRLIISLWLLGELRFTDRFFPFRLGSHWHRLAAATQASAGALRKEASTADIEGGSEDEEPEDGADRFGVHRV